MDNQDPARVYSMLLFLVKHGDRLAWIVSVGALALGIVYWAIEQAVWALPISVIGAIFLYVLLKSYVEMVRLIVDMMLPK